MIPPVVHRFALPLALVAAVSLAGCGDDDAATPDGPPSADAVVVLAQDIDFDQDEYSAPAGDVEFRYENAGNILHTLVIEDVGGLQLTVRSKGAVDSGSVDLDPGEYVIYCDVAGHRQAGMEATLSVS